MILDLTDVCSCENKELTKEAVIELTSFDSKLGVFPFIEKKPFRRGRDRRAERLPDRGERREPVREADRALCGS